MLVKTNPGVICPREDDPRSYITDDPKGVAVPDTSFYRRLLDDGSLVQIPPGPPSIKGGDKTKTGGNQ